MLNKLILLTGMLAAFILGCNIANATAPIVTKTVTVVQKVPVYIQTKATTAKALNMASAIPASALKPCTTNNRMKCYFVR